MFLFHCFVCLFCVSLGDICLVFGFVLVVDVIDDVVFVFVDAFFFGRLLLLLVSSFWLCWFVYVGFASCWIVSFLFRFALGSCWSVAKEKSNVLREMGSYLFFSVGFGFSLAGEVWLEVSGWLSWFVDRDCLETFALSSIPLRHRLAWSGQVRPFGELGVCCM